MTESTYNGWKNCETWNCGLWYGDSIFAELAQQYVDSNRLTKEDKEDYKHVQNLAEQFAEVVEETCGFASLEGFAKQIVGEALDAIDFHELAESYFESALPQD